MICPRSLCPLTVHPENSRDSLLIEFSVPQLLFSYQDSDPTERPNEGFSAVVIDKMRIPTKKLTIKRSQRRFRITRGNLIQDFY